MAITNYLVHFLTEDTYNSKKSELRNDAVAFVKDATIIHTHGTDYYCGSSPVALKSDLSGYATTSALTSGLAGKANTSHTHTASQVSDLAAVATSGSYNDLDDKPTIPAAYTLPTASASTLGGVKIGSGVVISSGVISVTTSSIGAATSNHTHSSYESSISGLESSVSTLTSKFDDYLPLIGGTIDENLTVSGELTLGGVSQQNGVIHVGNNTFTIYDTVNGGMAYNGTMLLTENNWDSYIPLDTDAVNKAGATNNTSLKLFLVGARHQAAGEFTYSNVNVYTQSGQLYATRMNATAGFYETSDATLKNFKEDIKALEVISKIPTKYFTWKKDELDEALDPELHIGTSAQEIQKLYPDLVTADEDGILSVDYARLSIVALAAIKELKVELDELKNNK